MHENAPVLHAERRDRLGSRYSRRLRESGKLPAVVYGHGQEPAAIALDARITLRAIHHGERVFRLHLDGQEDIVLLRDVQFDYLGDGIIHADLSRVSLDEVTHAHVRIRLVGEPAGLKQAGTALLHPHSELDIECKLRDLPDEIEVSITDLQAGGSITAGQIALPAGVRLLSDPNAVLATITSATAEAAAAEAAAVGGAAQPEVLTKKKEEEKA
jgi:large subunit ribosomal protein L25